MRLALASQGSRVSFSGVEGHFGQSRIRPWRTGLTVCYEAGPGGFDLYRLLRRLGVACEVIAPSLVPVRAGDRVKTDRRDAKKLVRLYRAGALSYVQPPTPETEGLRDLLRCRDDLRCARTAARHPTPP